jgi:hypothetical protein
MATFKDRLGREWRLTIDNGALDRARGLAGVNLVTFAGEDGCQALADLVADAERLGNLLFALAQPEAERRGISGTEFRRALVDADCQTLGQAIRALILALTEWQRQLIRVGSGLLDLKS